MSAAKQHTPGPWHVLIEQSGQDGDFITRTIVSSDIKQNLSEVAIATTGSFDDETEAANARLIAAAPEMLEALEEAKRIIEHHLNDWIITTTEQEKTLKKIEALVAKAKV